MVIWYPGKDTFIETGLLSNEKQINTMLKDIFVARQPIFDRDQKLWGFELLFRDNILNNFANIDDPTKATTTVASCGFLAATTDTSERNKIFINFTEESIIKELPHALPAACIVVELLENINITPLLIERLRDLKSEGYILALDDFAGDDTYLEIMDYIDIIKVDCFDKSIKELIDLKNKFANTSCMFLAEKVDSEAMYAKLKKSGFDLFQGYYFAKPEILRSKKLSSQNSARLKLASQIEREELDIKAIIDAIKSDVSMSYRLLRYINSSAFSFRNKIGSIKQALNLLGFKKVRHWLRLIIYSDMVSSHVNPEILRMTLQRAYFLENLGAENADNMPSHESLFLVGMFSLLEAMLHTPMAVILKNVPLSNEIKSTLMGEETLLSKYIILAQALECGDFAFVKTQSAELSLSESVVSNSFQEAIKMSDKLFYQICILRIDTE